MNRVKLERIENQIRKEVSNILQFEIKNSKFGFVTVTDVLLTNDYSFATIYVSFLNTKDIKSSDRLLELNRVKGVVKSSLSSKLSIRKTPDLIFKIDDSFDKGQKIESILTQIEIKEEETE